MKNLKKIFKVGFLSIVLTFVGCNKEENNNTTPDNPQPAVTKTPEKIDFTKVEFIFTEGHTHGLSFHGDPDYQNVKYLKLKQKITFELNNGRWENKGVQVLYNGNWVASDKNVIRWKQSSYFGVEAVYYDQNNQRINKNITEQKDFFQHFFQIENPQAIGVGSVPSDKNTIFSYLYRDTNPENKYFSGRDASVKLLESPIGLKGYFHVKKNHISFDLKVNFGRLLISKSDRKFYELPLDKEFISDLQIIIPIRIFTDQLSRDHNQIHRDYADEFGIEDQAIEDDEDAVLDADVNPESSQIWM